MTLKISLTTKSAGLWRDREQCCHHKVQHNDEAWE